MGLRATFDLECEACGKQKQVQEVVVANTPSQVSLRFDPTRAVLHREDQFYAFGHAWHICGRCANEAALAGMKRLQELRSAANARA